MEIGPMPTNTIDQCKKPRDTKQHFDILHAIRLEKNPPLGITVARIRDWMETGDPIISAAFDVATGKHMVELSEKELAQRFLGSEGAILEIERASKAGLLSESESKRLMKKLHKILHEIDMNFSEPWARESILHDMWKIQNLLDKRHYLSFLNWLYNGKSKKKAKK